MKTLQVAIIEHKHGTNTYVDDTFKGAEKQVADFCREWWSNEMGDVIIPENNDDIIEQYFSDNDYESCIFSETVYYENEFNQGDSFKELTKEEASEKMELVYIETEKSGFHIGLDFSYIDQIGDFLITLPTGEVINTKNLKK